MDKINSRQPLGREAALAVVAALCLVAVGCTAKPKSAPLGLASTYNAPCHFDNGGASFVVDTGCTLDATNGTVTEPSGSVTAGEIANVVRYINVPLYTFIECETDAGAIIGFDTTADTLADFVNSATDGTGFTLRFDDTGSSEDQASSVCNNLTVPADYASGGAFKIRAKKDAHTAATEVINCAVSVNGAALEVAGTVTTSTATSTAYTCTPTIAALAADDSVSFHFNITSDSTMNDLVDIAAVAFLYTATQ